MTAGLMSLGYRVGAPTPEGHCDIRWLVRRHSRSLPRGDFDCCTKNEGN